MASFSIRALLALFISFTLQLEGYVSLACMEEERVGLMKLKEAFNYPNGSALSSWIEQEKDCCMWENVKCDFTTKRVIKLSLNRTKNLSPINGNKDWYLELSLFHPFQELKNLSLEGNFLRGFTGEVRSRKLQYLDLSYNWLTEIPPFLTGKKSLKYLNLGALTNLKALSFRNNQLTGLCKLNNLEELDLSRNSLTGVMPSCLSNLTSLKLLQLSENLLTGNILPNLFRNLKSLEYVSLSYNHFKGLISFSSFSSNSKLEVLGLLDIGNNSISGEIPDWLGDLSRLGSLVLSNNSLEGRIPASFCKLKQLLEFGLEKNGC